MSRRREVLAELLDYLRRLPAGARVQWRRLPTSSDSPVRRHWPAEVKERTDRWDHLRLCLERMASAARIEVWPDGASGTHVAVFDWPEAQESLPFAGVPVEPAGMRQPENVTPVAIETLPLPEARNETRGEDVVAGAAGAVIRKPSKASRTCAGKILLLLFQRQERASGPVLVGLLEQQGYEVSISTVEATGSWLVERGILTNGRDRQGRGYGLADWTQGPEEIEGDAVGGTGGVEAVN